MLEKVIFGAGALGEVASELDRLGRRRALVLTGNSLATRTDLVKRLEGLLGGRWAGTHDGIRQHVPSRTVAAAVRHAREVRADAIVALGGGSPIDAAKIVALELLEDGQPQEAMPQIAVSTTLSAGEFTPFAGITDEDARVKGLRSDPRICPRTVVLDPEVTLPTPRRLWATTGVKALDHAIEAIWSVNPQPVSDVLAVEAIRRLHRHLPASLAEPDNLEARGECQIAAWMSIFGITSVGVRLSHILGHQHRRALGCPARHHLLHHHPALHALSRAADAPAAGDDCRGPGHPHGRARAGGGGSGGGGRRGRVHPLARRADPPARCRRQK